MKRAVLILAAIAFLITPLMVYPLKEGFKKKDDEPSTWSRIYSFFIGTDDAHIIGYCVLGITIVGLVGWMYSSRRAHASAAVSGTVKQGGYR